jgi:hypothetical protein
MISFVVSSIRAFRVSRSFVLGLWLDGLQYVEQGVEALELALPELTIAFQPFVGFRERPSLEPPRTSLRVAATRNQAGAFEHFEMFGNCGLAHRKRLSQFDHRGVTGSEPRQDCSPGGIGERGEGRVQVIGGRLSITCRFHNQEVIYKQKDCQGEFFFEAEKVPSRSWFCSSDRR